MSLSFIRFCIGIMLLGWSAVAHAATTAALDKAHDQGLAWLLRHQNGDGSWRSVPGTDFAATSSAVDALAVAGLRNQSYVTGLAWLVNAPVPSVDSLARKIATMTGAGMNATASAATLVSWRNAAIAWGAYTAFDTTLPDTPLALAALRISQYGYPSADRTLGLCGVIRAQAADGSWSFLTRQAAGTIPGAGSTGAILPTVHAMLEVNASGTSVACTNPTQTYTLATVVAAAKTWLLAQQKGDRGFGVGATSSVLDTILAYQALSMIAPAATQTTDALDYLVGRQAADGSWNGDALETALALKVIPVGTPYTVDSDVDTIPDRIETVLGANPTMPDSRVIARGNGLTSFPRATASNEFGLTIMPASLPMADRGTTGAGPTLHPSGASQVVNDPLQLARLRPEPLAMTVSLDAFQVDTLLGTVVGEVPIVVPPGPGGVVPRVVLRYDSGSADTLTSGEPAQSTGLGWSLDVGAVIVRDNKGTATLADDTFKLLLEGKIYDLKADGAGVYHTTDELFMRIAYSPGQDSWTITMKDGTRHRLGSSANSRWQTLSSTVVTPPNYDTAVTYKYLVDQITAPTGVAMTFAYAAETALVGARQYQTAVYVTSIAYASVSGATVGSWLRTLTFNRTARTDWPAQPPYPAYYDKNGALDSIEVRIGTALVRTYKLDYDYTLIDRVPGLTWHGTGATGDLALKTLKVYGNDGTTATLATATFGYSSNPGRLVTVNNGLGGTVAFQYARWLTPLFSVCVDQGCSDYGVCSDPDPWHNVLLGQLLASASPSPATIPVYATCARMGNTICADYSIGTIGLGTLLGYALSPSANPLPPNMVPLYVNCTGGCRASTTGGTLLGYMYPPTIADRNVVTTRTINDGRSGDVQTTYTYGGLSVTPGGDIRGFGWTAAQELASGAYPLTTTTWTYLSDNARPGRLASLTVAAGGTTRKSVTNTWTGIEQFPNSGIFFARLDQSTTSINDGGTFTHTRTMSYDAWGNVGTVISTATGANETRTEQTDWLANTVSWIFRPSRVALSGSVTGLVRERWLTHDAQGLLRQEEFRVTGVAGTPGNVIVSYDYDAYGNRRTVTDPAGCATTTVFDASQAFPWTRTTCVAGHTMTFAHDAGLGVPTSVTDANGVTLALVYDSFGRLLKITGPLADATYGWTSYAYGAWGNANAQSIRTYNGVGSWTDEYFDARGRVYARQRKGVGGVAITTQRVFDGRGQVVQQSVPYLPTEPIAWTTYSYDVLGRRTLTRYADQTTVATAYGAAGTATVTDERGGVKQITRDAWNRVTRIVEATGGQTSYSYDAAGSVLTVSDPGGGPATTITYDRLGRRLTLTDPSLGAWTFLYDTRGNLTDQTDGNNKTIHFSYDAYSRLTGKTYATGGGSVTWTYDDAAVAYGKGRLARIQDGVTTTTFAYDPAGRVTQLSRLLDGASYNLGLTYDAAGRVATRTFPDGETVAYALNEAGWLTAMTGTWPGGSRTYVNGIAYNGRGQRTSVQYGNGVITTLTYDPATSRLSGLLTLGPSGSLQNLTYAYDAAGNLVQIADGVGSATRRFAYDAGNRLVTASGWFNGVSEQYAYDVAGNLTGCASLVYAYIDPSHPWRLSMTADGRTYTYDGNGNVTSGAGVQLTWTFDNQLQTLTGPGGTETLAYDSQGQRVRKETNAEVTRSPFLGYEIDAHGLIRKTLGEVTRAGGVVLAYHDDHLGSTHVVTDAEGMPVQIVEYAPWGQLARAEGDADSTVRFRSADAASARPRVYDPSLGRFLNVDLVVPEAGDSTLRNRYAFGRNNPATLPDMVRPGLREEF